MSKRKHVKLDTSGLTEFKKTFGSKGFTFHVGLFKPTQARKGALLEYGEPSNNQPPRPWLSAITFTGTSFHKDLMKILAAYVRTTFAGQDPKTMKREAAIKIEERVKDFVADQEFVNAGKKPVPELKQYTKDLKELFPKSRYSPDSIGIDSSDMLRAIEVRYAGKNSKK